MLCYIRTQTSCVGLGCINKFRSILLSYNNTTKYLRTFILGCVLMIVIILLGLLFNTHKFSTTHALKLATTHQPERLTELYFSNPQSLPTQYTQGKSLPVAFTIHNAEYQSMIYSYTITAVSSDGNQSQTLVINKVDMGDNQTMTIANSIVPTLLSPRISINVLLVNKNQSIHFWVERK